MYFPCDLIKDSTYCLFQTVQQQAGRVRKINTWRGLEESFIVYQNTTTTDDNNVSLFTSVFKGNRLYVQAATKRVPCETICWHSHMRVRFKKFLKCCAPCYFKSWPVAVDVSAWLSPPDEHICLCFIQRKVGVIQHWGRGRQICARFRKRQKFSGVV